MKKFLKVLLIVLAVILAAAVLFIAFLSVTEYKPDDVTPLDITGSGSSERLQLDSESSVISWNIGYAGLGAGSDFFMDGGDDVRSADKETVMEYLTGIADTLDENSDTHIFMLQEVDASSSRTYKIDERQYLARSVSAYALNYSCAYVPYPLPPIGTVHSGLYTTTDYEIDTAERISLPCPFSWPVSTANLKRCLLVSYLPIEGSDSQLVLVNLHLEAYDSGEGKIAQTNQLREFIENEYAKGNYVIAGGDFNQVFPETTEVFPNTHEDLWVPGVIEDNLLPEGWSLAYDMSYPSCRLLNQAYDPSDVEDTQYYVIDGYIVSPNVTVSSVETLHSDFAYSDHNPVKLTFSLNG